MDSLSRSQPGTSADASLTSGTSYEVSRAAVCGIFLTLALCLLTQPLGSLLYRPVQGSFGTLLFSLWRLNPTACFIEAAIIAAILGQAVWRSTTSPHSELGWFGTVHTTVTALLLLRAEKRGEWGVIIVERFIMMRHRNEEEAKLPKDYGLAHNNSSTLREYTSNYSTTPATPSAGLTTQKLPRQRTLIVEEGREGDQQHTPASHAPVFDWQAALREALGSNALSHSEIFVDIVTIFSMGTISIKLIAASLPWTVLVPAIGMISGWVMVQLLLGLLHLKELSSLEMEAIADEARRLQRQATPSHRPLRTTIILIVVLSAPAIVYLDMLLFTTITNFAGWARIGILYVFLFMARFSTPNFDDLKILKLFSYVLGGYYILMAALVPLTLFSKWLWFVGYWLPSLHALFLLMVWPAVEYGNCQHAHVLGISLNLTVTIAVFFLFILGYDSSGTYKPEWLEWLG